MMDAVASTEISGGGEPASNSGPPGKKVEDADIFEETSPAMNSVTLQELQKTFDSAHAGSKKWSSFRSMNIMRTGKHSSSLLNKLRGAPKRVRKMSMRHTGISDARKDNVLLHKHFGDDERAEPKYQLPDQKLLKKVYDNDRVQLLIAFFIITNFVFSAMEAQTNPPINDDVDRPTIFFVAELFHAIFFTLELLLNMYAHYFLFFWTGPDWGWNRFDFIVVVVSALSLCFDNLPYLGVLRLLRAFRVVRILRRLEGLRNIVEGVVFALPGVMEAFMILVVFMGIWSIIAVSNFRNGVHGKEMYGDFSKAMFTTFQMLTGDSWASHVTRKLVFEDGYDMAAIHSITFIFITEVVISNVVVAILLEKYLTMTKTLSMKRNRQEVKQHIKSHMTRMGIIKAEVGLGEATTRFGKLLHRWHLKGMKAELAVFEWFDGCVQRIKNSVDDTSGLPYQDKLAWLYFHPNCQLFIGGVICGNFVCEAANAQVLPQAGSRSEEFFDTMEMTFQVTFLVELLFNMYANYFWRFYIGPDAAWNLFDLFIVVVSWAGSSVGVFRLFRAFRVIRLFKRVPSLRLIVESIFLCLAKVLQAFLIMLMLTAVWAIMGVRFFGEKVPNEFGDFAKAFLTMWQVMTCDGWASSENMARHIVFDPLNMPEVGCLFFITYIIANYIILSNVVVTILLEGYLTCVDNAKAKAGYEVTRHQGRPGMRRTKTVAEVNRGKSSSDLKTSKSRSNLDRTKSRNMKHKESLTAELKQNLEMKQLEDEAEAKYSHLDPMSTEGRLARAEAQLAFIAAKGAKDSILSAGWDSLPPGIKADKAEQAAREAVAVAKEARRVATFAEMANTLTPREGGEDATAKTNKTEAEMREEGEPEETQEELRERLMASKFFNAGDPFANDINVVIATLKDTNVRRTVPREFITDLVDVMSSRQVTARTMEYYLNEELGGAHTKGLMSELRGDESAVLSVQFLAMTPVAQVNPMVLDSESYRLALEQEDLAALQMEAAEGRISGPSSREPSIDGDGAAERR